MPQAMAEFATLVGNVEHLLNVVLVDRLADLLCGSSTDLRPAIAEYHHR